MEEVISDLVVGLMAGVFALLGLILAAHAVDREMLVFGVGLVLFGTVFVISRVSAFAKRKSRLAQGAAGAAGGHHG